MSAIRPRLGVVATRWRSAWPAFLLLAVGELLLAGLAAAGAGVALATALGRRPALEAVANGDWLNVLVDLQVAAATAATEGAQAAPTVAGEGMIAVGLGMASGLVAVGLQGLLYTFVAGAALELMAGRHVNVWRAGATWFWPMLRLGMVLVVVAIALGGVVATALALAPGRAPPLVAIKLAALAVWMGAIGSWFELARATMVVQVDRAALRGIRRALQLLRARPWIVAGTWLGLGAGNLALSVILVGLMLATSTAAAGPAWIVILLTVGAGSAYKLFRLAAQLHLAGLLGRA